MPGSRRKGRGAPLTGRPWNLFPCLYTQLFDRTTLLYSFYKEERWEREERKRQFVSGRNNLIPTREKNSAACPEFSSHHSLPSSPFFPRQIMGLSPFFFSSLCDTQEREVLSFPLHETRLSESQSSSLSLPRSGNRVIYNWVCSFFERKIGLSQTTAAEFCCLPRPYPTGVLLCAYGTYTLYGP